MRFGMRVFAELLGRRTGAVHRAADRGLLPFGRRDRSRRQFGLAQAVAAALVGPLRRRGVPAGECRRVVDSLWRLDDAALAALLDDDRRFVVVAGDSARDGLLARHDVEGESRLIAARALGADRPVSLVVVDCRPVWDALRAKAQRLLLGEGAVGPAAREPEGVAAVSESNF